MRSRAVQRMLRDRASTNRQLIDNGTSDERATKCGHNFKPGDCPYQVCGYRYALEDLTRALRENHDLKLKLTMAQPRQGAA